MRKLAILTTLALALSVAAPLAAQDKQDKDKNDKGALGGVLDTLGNVLGTGTQKLQGTVVLSEGSTFVMRTDDKRTYRIDTASLDPQKVGALTPGQAVSVTARGGGQAGVLTASEITPDAKSSGKTFQTVSGTVQEASRQRVLFKTRDGLVLPVDVSNINGLPYLAANQPATLYYEQGSRQEVVGVWVQPGSGQPSASQPSTSSAPSASVSSPRSLEGQVESIGVAELKLQTSDGRAVTVDTSGVDRQTMRGISPGDSVTVTGTTGTTSDRFVAQSVQPRR
jgi:translation initiation factor IF-1